VLDILTNLHREIVCKYILGFMKKSYLFCLLLEWETETFKVINLPCSIRRFKRSLKIWRYPDSPLWITQIVVEFLWGIWLNQRSREKNGV
jgi:hypothetical protein